VTDQSIPAVAASPSSWRGRSALGLAAALSLYLFALTIADPDLWGHVKFGQDLLATGRIVRPDPYSFLTGDQAWINHEWLAEALFAAVFAALGSPGLIALKTAVALLMLGLVGWHLGGWGVGPAIVLTGTVGLLLPWFASIRPQMFTYLCFLLLLLLIHRAERGQTRRLWLAPMLFAVWANLHGGVLAGLIMLTLWFLAHLVGGTLRADLAAPAAHRVVVPVILSFCATLVNPYGIWLLVFLVRTASGARPDISEWAPIDLMSPFGWVYVAVAGTAGVAVFHSRRPRRTALMLLLAGATLSPLLAVRHAPLCCLAVAALAGEHIVDGWTRVVGRATGGAAQGRGTSWVERVTAANLPRRGVAGVLALGALAFLGLALPEFRCIHIRAGDFPAPALALLQRSGTRGALAIHFDWGEYAIWHLSPRIKVSYDGRRETVYSDRVRVLNDEFTLGTGQWDRLLASHEVDMALVSKAFPVSNLMKRMPGWRSLYEDSQAALFVREGARPMSEIGRTPMPVLPPEGTAACWPGVEPREGSDTGRTRPADRFTETAGVRAKEGPLAAAPLRSR
jgi:hypothetical protein